MVALGLLVTIYGHGGHLGHVTLLIYKQIGTPIHDPIDASYEFL